MNSKKTSIIQDPNTFRESFENVRDGQIAGTSRDW